MLAAPERSYNSLPKTIYMNYDLPVYLDIINKLILIIGVPIAIWKYIKSKEKERKDREYGTYNSLDEKFIEYQRICLSKPYLDVFDVPDKSPGELTEEQRKEELIIFSILFSIFERAFLLYSDGTSRIKKNQWTGWHQYIEAYCYRANFLKAWSKSGSTFDLEFQAFMEKLIGNCGAQTGGLPSPKQVQTST